MTFDEWADQYDLMDHERRLCREYLAYLRTQAFLRWLMEWMREEGGSVD